MDKKPFSKLAIASAILGIVGVLFAVISILYSHGIIPYSELWRILSVFLCVTVPILGILSFIFGITARDQINKSKLEDQRTEVYATIGIIESLIIFSLSVYYVLSIWSSI